MSIVTAIQRAAVQEIMALYQVEEQQIQVQVTETKPEFEGDYTVVLFGLTKMLKQSPEAVGQALGQRLAQQHPDFISSYNVIKGFLNLSISDSFWTQFLYDYHQAPFFGFREANGHRIMVEYSSPNTNKPLHLGHLRNIFLGWSIAAIFRANGFDVIKSCIVNDRGIHICKSMLAWQKFGNNATPETTGTKGDHLVGDYYVKFEKELQRQAALLSEAMGAGDFSQFTPADAEKLKQLQLLQAQQQGSPEKIATLKAEINDLLRNNTAIMREVREMLLKWENGDPEVLNLWRQMNNWVYDGFGETYRRIGADFDITYYESETYLLGKDFVQEGISSGLFHQREDGSVWIDLTSDGLDEKLLLRSDGTSVYITQDLGLAKSKYDAYGMEKSIYVIGDEQNYHMKVLKLICRKLGIPNAENIFHLSYGMVELPGGRMKSREGTVVDADDIVSEMVNIAENKTLELGKVDDFTKEELDDLYHTIGLGALKFYLLRVDPKKRMIFNPEESIDFHGFTGPFIQYAHARTKSILRKAQPAHIPVDAALLPAEKKLIVELEKYPVIIEQAGAEMNPSVVANYAFRLAQIFNSFVAELRILTAESEDKRELRLQLADMTVNVLSSAMGLLGIRVPERM